MLIIRPKYNSEQPFHYSEYTNKICDFYPYGEYVGKIKICLY